MKNAIIWLRKDLRLSDNPALSYVAQNNHKVIFLYILDKNEEIGSASKWFLHYSLKSLKEDLKNKYNANLLIKIGSAKDILQKLIAKYHINHLFYNRIYEPQNIVRDSEIKSYFNGNNICVKSFKASLLFEPWEIKNLSGNCFKVFTPFWKKCLSELQTLSEPYKVPKSFNLINFDNNDSLTVEDLNLLPKKPNWAKGWDKIWFVSEKDANDLADKFIKNKIFNYKINRDFPSLDATSKLSPYLHYGLISPKQLYFKSLPYLNNQSANHFLSEIGWREFSYSLLYYYPELPNKNFKSDFDKFPWENNMQLLEKWQKGKTGIAIVDAGMRELYQTGWMHNRVRMIVASFLTKNLLIDWRLGAKWFFDCLVDADLASNSASWQWVAGSGADAAPYFRIFNPILQGDKFDKSCSYIKKYIPELSDFSAKDIYNSSHLSCYYKPVIDLKISREKALFIYKSLKG